MRDPYAELRIKDWSADHAQTASLGAYLDWEDPGASVSFGTVIEDGASMRSVRESLKLTSGNGECRKRPFPDRMGDDIEEMLCKSRTVRAEKWTAEAAGEMLQRWEERELAWMLKIVVAKSRVPIERMAQLLQEAVVESTTEL